MKLVVSQNTFYCVIKIVPPFHFQSLITGVTISRVRKEWKPGGLFFILTMFHTLRKQEENCNSAKFNIYIFGEQTGRQKILHQNDSRHSVTSICTYFLAE
jgi:hypothetical protein